MVSIKPRDGISRTAFLRAKGRERWGGHMWVDWPWMASWNCTVGNGRWMDGGRELVNGYFKVSTYEWTGGDMWVMGLWTPLVTSIVRWTAESVYSLGPVSHFLPILLAGVTAEQYILSNSKCCQINEHVYWENGTIETTGHLHNIYFKMGKMLWKFLKYSKQFRRKHNVEGAFEVQKM
jgi:hypothetical protein